MFVDIENALSDYALYEGFTSTEDGYDFIRLLEGMTIPILKQLPSSIYPSQIDHILAICRRDGKADVYVNELDILLCMRPAWTIKAGEVLSDYDTVDIERVNLGVQIPDDAGILFLFSFGWRKGLFYDFGPIDGPDPSLRQYDVNVLLARAFCQVSYQERFSLSDAEWDALFSSQWFLFTGLGHNMIETLISYIRSGLDPDEKLDNIVSKTKSLASRMLNKWREHSVLVPHIDILERAVERFKNNDYISCSGLLFSRIEGILRTHHTSLGTQSYPSPKNLAESAVVSKIENKRSLLLPQRFSNYLQNVYFADFDLRTPDINVSRHSVAHGVAATEKFDQKAAVIGILTVHQLSYFFLSEKGKE